MVAYNNDYLSGKVKVTIQFIKMYLYLIICVLPTGCNLCLICHFNKP